MGPASNLRWLLGHLLRYTDQRCGLVKGTIGQAREGGYTNFILRPADDHGFSGFILPPFNDGRRWTLENPGDTVATVYQVEDRAFTVTFPFPQALGSPSDYAATVSGLPSAIQRAVDSATGRMTVNDVTHFVHLDME